MGIRGLHSWINWAVGMHAYEEIDWSLWKHKRIGIDILGFLYKAKGHRINPFLYLARMLAACKKHNIYPVPIFDGKPPSEKKDTLLQRSAGRIMSEKKKQNLVHDMNHITMNEIQRDTIQRTIQRLESNASYFTSEERDVAKQLCYACGIMPYNATGEADSVLAFLYKNNYISAVISNDLDLLARGVDHLMVPDFYSFPGDPAGWRMVRVSCILSHASLSYLQFVELCVLMGCDYTLGDMRLPYKTAYWAVKYGLGLVHVLKKHNIPNTEKYKKAMELLLGHTETHDTLMGQKQWEKWNVDLRVECENLSQFRDMYLQPMNDDEYNYLLQDHSVNTNVFCIPHNHPECAYG